MPKYRQGKKKRGPYDANKKGSNPEKDQQPEDLLGSEVNCGVCNKIIIEQCAQNPGEEAVFCEDQCKTWLH